MLSSALHLKNRYLLPGLMGLMCLSCAKSEPEPDSRAADFSFTGTLQNSTPILFSSTSLKAKSCSWDFGDGSAFSTDLRPTHTFRKAGAYSVTLSVTTAGGPVAQTQRLTLAQADTLAPIFAAVVGKYKFTKIKRYSYNNYTTTGISATYSTEACDIPATTSRSEEYLQLALGGANPVTTAGKASMPTPTSKYYYFSASRGSVGNSISFKMGTDSIEYYDFQRGTGGGWSTTYYGKRQ